jgi:polysaccharide export outer membrane protein
MKIHLIKLLFLTGLLAGSALATDELPAEGGASENYLLTANDQITVKVFQEDDLTTTCRVAADGTVGLPLVGQVKVAGETTQEASRQIARLFDARFLVNPQVSVSVVSFARRRFTMLGEVLKAGAYLLQFQDSIDLLEAIGMAGGYTRLANPSKITVKRVEGGHEVILKVDGKELANGHGAKGFRVRAGDTVTVGERIF